MTLEIPPHPLIAEIQAFCLRHSMSLKAFGISAVNDPTFAYAVVRGQREPTRQTAARVQRFMDHYTAAKDAA